VLDENHLLAAVRYVELNPVRAGMAEKAWEYPWSSASFHVGISNTDPLVKSRSLMGLTVEWQGFLMTEDDDITNGIRTASRTGRPLGDAAFLEKVGLATRRNLRYGKRGRPRKHL
jgi:putative transposase